MLFAGSRGPVRRALQIAQALGGLAGALCAIAASASRRWDAHGGGLWDDPQPRLARAGFRDETAVQWERVYAGVACVLAAASAAVCLHLLVFWDQRRHGTPALHRERTLVPSSLLLAVLMPTGVLMLIPWASFTVRSSYEGGPSPLRFGFSYGLALIGWILLLAAVPLLALLEQCLDAGVADGVADGVAACGVATDDVELKVTDEVAAQSARAGAGVAAGDGGREAEPERERLLRSKPVPRRCDEEENEEAAGRARPMSDPVSGGGGGGKTGRRRRGAEEERGRKGERQTRAY